MRDCGVCDENLVFHVQKCKHCKTFVYFLFEILYFVVLTIFCQLHSCVQNVIQVLLCFIIT